MLPAQLTAASFSAYAPEARALAVRNLTILNALPLSFLPLLLRELMAYDWRFPAERLDLDQQFRYLNSLQTAQLASLVQPFTALHVSPELQRSDWVNQPAAFSEQLSAYLWSTHQMDAFRKASVDYVHTLNAAKPKPPPLPVPRVSMIVIGKGAGETRRPLFRKLRRYGTHYTAVQPGDGFSDLLDVAAKRASTQPIEFAHWYIDGSSPQAAPSGLATVSYEALRPIRSALIRKMSSAMQPNGGGPELLRSQLASLQPTDLGMRDGGATGILNRFQLSLLTEGSGTQIFSTTFVQWAAREVLRRAQPLTLVARFSPRQREAMVQSPDALHSAAAVLDPDGSLVDADMAAYYTWINQGRLPGSEDARFLVWFEDHAEAFACAPHLKAGAANGDSIRLKDVAFQLSA